MLKFVVRRLGVMVLTALALTFIVFYLTNLPPNLEKLARTEGENGKIAIRNLRRDANESVKKLVKDKLASEDDQKRAEADVQKLTDKRMTEIDQLVAAKEQEIMAV